MMSRLPISTLFPYTTLFRSKLLQHLRKLFCIVAVALINVVKQWQVFIGRAEQRIADLPKIGPPLLVLAPFGQLALKRSEEHTSELQSHSDLVCRLLLEKKKK